MLFLFFVFVNLSCIFPTFVFLQLSRQPLPGQDPGTNPTTENKCSKQFSGKAGPARRFTAGVQPVLLSSGSAH